MRKLNMPRRLSSSAARTHGGNMLFMLPTIILFCIVVLIPFFQGIPYSFTNWKSIVSETKEFNGLKNYIYLIKNKYFQDSLLVTFKFTILYMISANVMGLLLALAIHRSSWFNNIARTVLFLPFTVSATAGSIVWSYVFTDVYGTITGLVSPLGMPGQIIYGMVVIGAWRDMGYTMLIYIAALQAVPQDYYEAATVDGAGKLRQFFSDLQDKDYESAIATVHSRFSTNTNPSWERAHPNRFIVHNGEINTIRGNAEHLLQQQGRSWSGSRCYSDHHSGGSDPDRYTLSEKTGG